MEWVGGAGGSNEGALKGLWRNVQTTQWEGGWRNVWWRWLKDEIEDCVLPFSLLRKRAMMVGSWHTALVIESLRSCLKSQTQRQRKSVFREMTSVLGPFLPQWNMFFWDFWLISRAVLSKAEKTEVFARVGSCDSESRWTLVLRLRQGNVGYYNYFSRFELFLGLLANSLHLFLTLLSSDKHYRTPQLQKNIHFFQSFCNNIICLNDL